MTALSYAFNRNKLVVVKYLIIIEADINVKDNILYYN